MDATIFVGPVSSGPLYGGDLAYEVGFVVAGAVYLALRMFTRARAATRLTAPVPGGLVPAPVVAPDRITNSADLPPAE